MPCEEVMELENIWQKRYERANAAEAGGLFAIPAATPRQLRAKQAQAAQAILQHQKQCPICNSQPTLEWSITLAS